MERGSGAVGEVVWKLYVAALRISDLLSGEVEGGTGLEADWPTGQCCSPAAMRRRNQAETAAVVPFVACLLPPRCLFSSVRGVAPHRQLSSLAANGQRGWACAPTPEARECNSSSRRRVPLRTQTRPGCLRTCCCLVVSHEPDRMLHNDVALGTTMIAVSFHAWTQPF